jgi:acyl-CoA synthetase (AMP-forming)/AMP-acid ligase II
MKNGASKSKPSWFETGYSISEDEIIAHCRQHLAGFKVPKSVDYADAIPRNAVGKMLKKELRKPYWEGKNHLYPDSFTS